MINWLKKFWDKKVTGPTTWFTSDLHFGHKNVITYCNRPWATLDEMHPAIIAQWNSQVKPEDTVYVLGDFSLSPKWSGQILPLLNGKKILVCGNHDACFPKKLGQSDSKTLKMVDRYRNDGWFEIHQTETCLWLKNDRYVKLCHFPYDTEYDERYKENRPKGSGWLLHGHLHAKYRKKGNQIDVAFDGDLKLWSEDDIIGFINDSRQFIPTPITEFYKTKNLDKSKGLRPV